MYHLAGGLRSGLTPSGASGIIQPAHPRKRRRDGSSKREATLDARLRRKLQDFERALVEAISESDEASRVLEELRGEGFALYLLLDGSGDGLEEALNRRGEIPPTAVAMPPRRALPPAAPAAEPRSEPVFRIDGRDLAFLRALGIDPTRTLRRRRAPRDGEAP